MSSNSENIQYSDFKNICRTCLFNSDFKLKTIQQNNIIIEFLHNLIGLETNDDLPQQICLNCFEKISEIHAFTSRCKQTHTRLMECVNNYKKQETVEIKEETTNEEHKIEFVPVEETNATIDETKNCFHEVNIKIENNPLENIEDKKKFMCHVCNKKFMHLASFKRHRTLHTGERPFICDVCNKTFSEAGTLKAHKRIHSGERPYKCDICFKAYTGANNLKVHQIKHSGEHPYKCEVCQKAFNDVRVMRNHMATHSSERPFECDVCTKTFKLSSDLIRHKRTHNDERCYECDVCGKTFHYSSTLVRHKRIHSGERPYKCDICEQGFIESGALKKHKLLHEKRKLNFSDILLK